MQTSIHLRSKRRPTDDTADFRMDPTVKLKWPAASQVTYNAVCWFQLALCDNWLLQQAADEGEGTNPAAKGLKAASLCVSHRPPGPDTLCNATDCCFRQPVGCNQLTPGSKPLLHQI